MNRNGFTLIEIMVGMLVFVIGVLALASSTGFVSMQLHSSDLRTERSAAVQQATEAIHATDFDAIAPLAASAADTVGAYRVWWDVSSLRWALKEVSIYAEGPGFVDGHRADSVRDTVTFHVARPVQ